MDVETRKSEELETGQDGEPVDIESIRGVFGWATIEDINIPYILRGGMKFVSLRILGKELISKYITASGLDVWNNNPLDSYQITEAEARLLDEINSFHCNFEYGEDGFNKSEYIVELDKFQELFMSLRSNSLTSSNKSTQDLCDNEQLKQYISTMCGWIQINNTVLPYVLTTKDSKSGKYVPISVLVHAAKIFECIKFDSSSATIQECSLLNTLCRISGIDFKFSKQTKLLLASELRGISNVRISEDLPFGNPLQTGCYIYKFSNWHKKSLSQINEEYNSASSNYYFEKKSNPEIEIVPNFLDIKTDVFENRQNNLKNVQNENDNGTKSNFELSKDPWTGRDSKFAFEDLQHPYYLDIDDVTKSVGDNSQPISEESVKFKMHSKTAYQEKHSHAAYQEEHSQTAYQEEEDWNALNDERGHFEYHINQENVPDVISQSRSDISTDFPQTGCLLVNSQHCVGQYGLPVTSTQPSYRLLNNVPEAFSEIRSQCKNTANYQLQTNNLQESNLYAQGKMPFIPLVSSNLGTIHKSEVYANKIRQKFILSTLAVPNTPAVQERIITNRNIASTTISQKDKEYTKRVFAKKWSSHYRRGNIPKVPMFPPQQEHLSKLLRQSAAEKDSAPKVPPFTSIPGTPFKSCIIDGHRIFYIDLTIGSRTGSFCLVQLVALVFFPKVSPNLFIEVLKAEPQIKLYDCPESSEKLFWKYWKTCFKGFIYSLKLINLDDLRINLPRLHQRIYYFCKTHSFRI